jgi:hypothetical protein
MNNIAATQIQKVWKSYIHKKKNIPNSLQSIGIFLNNIEIKCSSNNSDGRINSCFDEDTCVKLLKKEYTNRIRIPTKRNWYDILVKDYQRGWIPCNIKSTLTTTSDNTGNLAMCVYAYTNHDMNILKQYNNGKMSIILHNKIKNKQYNISLRDYYFIVINKSTNVVIINSCKGLTKLTPNVNNLPFQVCWSKNIKYIYKPIHLVVNNFVNTIQHPSPSWKETFLSKMRKLNINE